MTTAVQTHKLNDPASETPLSRRLPLVNELAPSISDSESHLIHVREETSTYQTVQALWNGTPVLFLHSDHEVHPDRIVIGRSKGKDYPILICKVYNRLLFEPDTEPSVTGFAAFPRPMHAENYKEAGEDSLMGGPADLLAGSVGSVAFNSYVDPVKGKTAQIDWLQGSICPRKIQLSSGPRIITPSITRRYFNWDIKLVKRAFEHFQKGGFENILFSGDILSLKQFQRQLEIFSKAAANTGFTPSLLNPAAAEGQIHKKPRILEMRKKAVSEKKK